MPDVRMPDGTIIRNVPAGTTRAQLEARWKAAGPAPRAQSSGSSVLDGVLSTFNNAVVGGVQGVENLGAAITDPIVGAIWGDRSKQQVQHDRQAKYDRWDRAIAPVQRPTARTVGQIASTLPFAAAKAPAALSAVAPRAATLAARAGQGAIGGAAVRDSNSDAGQSVGVGIAANLALPPVVGLVANSRPGRWLGDKLLGAGGQWADDAAAGVRQVLGLKSPARLPAGPDPLADFFAPTTAGRAAPAVPPQAERLAQLGRAAQMRAARLRAAGVERPTTGMVTRSPRAWTAERELAKRPGVGDDIQQALVQANQQISDRARQLVGNQGGAIGPEATGQRVSTALSEKNEQLSAEVGALYRGVRDTVGDVRVPSLENFKSAQAHPDWMDNTQFDDMVAAVNKRLLRYAEADGGAAGLSVKQAEEMRKFIGNLGTNSSQTFAMRRVLQNGLDADVIDNIGGEPFANARAAAAARFAEFKGTFPGRVADEGIPPERLTGRVMGAPLSDVRALNQSLSTGTASQQQSGEEAARALRAQALEDIFGGNRIVNDGTNVSVNGKALADAFSAKAPVLRELLSPSDYKDVRRLALSARDVNSPPAASYVNYSNTASASANAADGLFPGIDPPQGLGPLGKAATRAAGALAGGAIGAVGGPFSSIASAGGGYGAAQGAEAMLASRAQQRYAEQLRRAVEIARDPYLAADSLAAPDPAEARRLLIERWQNLAGNNGVLAGTAASTRKR